MLFRYRRLNIGFSLFFIQYFHIDYFEICGWTVASDEKLNFFNGFSM